MSQPKLDWEGFAKDRERLKKEPKNIKNLLDYMRASASILEVYQYVEDWEEKLTKWKNTVEMNDSKDPKALILRIILGVQVACVGVGEKTP